MVFAHHSFHMIDADAGKLVDLYLSTELSTMLPYMVVFPFCFNYSVLSISGLTQFCC